MNIAYISADFGVPIFGYKGASIHVREMVNALCRAGHSLWVISPKIENSYGGMNGKGEGHFTSPLFPPFSASFAHYRPLYATMEEGVTFFPVLPPQEHHFKLVEELGHLDKLLGLKTRVRQELRNLLYNLTLYEKTRDYLLMCHADLIYERYTLFSYAGIRLARELGVPHILEVNAPLAYEQEKMRGLEMKALAQAMEHRILGETDRVIVVSRRLQEYVASCGVPESRIHLLPNAVDPQRFALLRKEGKETVRASYQLEGKCIIGFVGSLKPWHGVETLVEAFRKLRRDAPNVHLMIVGEGPERERLEKDTQTEGLDDAVTFTGNVSYEDIPHYIAAMDITVAPYVPNENFYYSPIKLFEYMAMGKPVVAAKIGQVEELIVNDETGVLFKPGNTAQLTAVLARLVNDSQLRHRLGEKAKAWVQNERTWEKNAQQVTKIAVELIEKYRAISEDCSDLHSTSLAASWS